MRIMASITTASMVAVIDTGLAKRDFHSRFDRSKNVNYDKELDARGLNCPLPILRSKKALADMSSGQVLRVLSTDPGSVRDIAAFAKQTGNELLSSTENDKVFEFFLKRK